jgi:hypothetical protein
MEWFGQWYDQWFGQWFGGASSGNVTATVECGLIEVSGFDANAVTNSVVAVRIFGGASRRRITIDVTASVDVGEEYIVGFDADARTNVVASVDPGLIEFYSTDAVAKCGCRSGVGLGSISYSGADCTVETVDFEMQLVALMAAEME